MPLACAADFYANVTNNVMKRVYTGILANNFSVSKGSPWLVQGNNITAYANGIWHNQAYSSATVMTLDNNHFATEALLPVANSIGMLFTLGPGGILPNVTNNVVDKFNYGVVAWGTPGGLLLGNTNSITNSTVGVYATNNLAFNPIGTTVFGLTATPSAVTIDHMTIMGIGHGRERAGRSGGGATSVTLQNSCQVSGTTTGSSGERADRFHQPDQHCHQRFRHKHQR